MQAMNDTCVLQSADNGRTFPRWDACSPAFLLLQLGLALPAAAHASISFPWPVDSLSANIRVRRRQAAFFVCAPCLLPRPVWGIFNPLHCLVHQQ
jgi:hypothetical protein